MPLSSHRQAVAPATSGSGNRVLAAMTRAEQALLAQMTELVDLPLGATLFAPGEHVEHLVFPATGLVSLVLELPDGSRAEVGMVGREGFVGLPALLGERTSPVRAVVQVPGHGHRVGVAALQMLADGSRNLRDLVRRQAMAAVMHASLTAACNASHALEQRTARWLLSVQDRVGPGFPITQEYLATMVGARRPTVNAVLRTLRSKGLIRHARGWIAIADSTGLEAAACPCYRTERAALARLLQGDFRQATDQASRTPGPVHPAGMPKVSAS